MASRYTATAVDFNIILSALRHDAVHKLIFIANVCR